MYIEHYTAESLHEGSVTRTGGAVYLCVKEAKEFGESVSDVGETEKHQRNADHGVRDAHNSTPECLGRYVPVAWTHHSNLSINQSIR